MKFLRVSKITEKLTWLQLTLVFGFVVIALAYSAVVIVDANSAIRTARLTDFQFKMEGAELSLLQARRGEKDFLLRFDKKYIDKQARAMQGAYLELDKALQLAPTEETRTLVSEIRNHAQGYAKAFREAADEQIRLGLDEKSGQHGAMRKAVHEVESLVNEFNNPVLKSSMLMMRRHEKDFIQRESDKYIRRMAGEQKNFASLLAASDLPEKTSERIGNLMAAYHATFKDFTAGTTKVNNAIVFFRDAVHKTEPLLEAGVKVAEKLAQQNKAESERLSLMITVAFAIIILVIGAITIISLLHLSKGLSQSLGRLTDTVDKASEGDSTARTELETPDELGELGRAFDRMLTERVATLARVETEKEEAEKENERLNDSVIVLMEAVGELSNRDLTVTAPVAEDVTGPVADAVNMMAAETARVLKEIRDIATEVESASGTVREQGQKVSDVAKSEGRIVQETTAKLEQASHTMNEIAVLANKCNEIGERANEYTTRALETVGKTANGMADVRETISESEKRIKRLGERSQEISAVIEIINNIAERTQVLALNASMQAAAAGDAGRGFAVVADEVQRLAESSRQSTSEIEALVRNIQTETSDAMMTMNKTIEQVVDGAELAEQAGQQMDETQKTTGELAGGVKRIAKRALQQAKASKELQQQANILHEGNLETDRELSEQAKHTENLSTYAQRLVQSVSVFKLPA